MSEDLEIEVVETTALETLTKAEIDTQISTAKKYPRSIGNVKESMMAFATLDSETAASCFYAKPQGGKTIQGPSIRLAEIALACYQNIRAGARIISDDGKTLTAQGVCHDLENNTCVTVEVMRPVLTKAGKRFQDHMIVTTANAACAIALRNAVFKVVPMALVNPVYEAAKTLAIGDAKSLADRRAASISHFAKMGISEERVLGAIGRPTVEDVTVKDLEKLIGFANAIKNDDATIDEVFPDVQDPAAELTERLNQSESGKSEPKDQSSDKTAEDVEVNHKDLTDDEKREIKESEAAEAMAAQEAPAG